MKNRCAWVNHSGDPTAFIRLVQRYDNIRLWASGELCSWHRRCCVQSHAW